MKNIKSLIKKYTEQSQASVQPATESELSLLEELGATPSVIDFYKLYNPTERIPGFADMIPISDIYQENTTLPPGSHILKHGFLVFAFNECGDAYCFDLNTNPSRVILVTSEEPLESFSKEELLEHYIIHAADDINDFLERVLDESLIQDPYSEET